MKFISSLDNPIIKELTRINKRRKDKSIFLIEGFSLIETALKSKNMILNYLLITKEMIAKTKFLTSNINHEKILCVSDEIIKKLSQSVTPQGVMASVTYRINTLHEITFRDLPFLLILDGINDPGNLGTIIRTSEAFGVDAIIILPNTCDVFSPKVIRATAGSIFHLHIIYCNHYDLKDYLNKKSICLIITEPHSGSQIWNVDFNRPIAIALGNEAKGISTLIKDLRHEKVSIITTGMTESLNVAMAGSIILYEVFRQRVK
ncbi:MAG: RNA methyltransferase [Thermodesulfovibrionales bacterium]|nr:RNA methyltransferase [Thermodesulfovibrionales bacterium]